MATTATCPNATSIPDEAHENARRRATYASFGDEDGATATATAYGHLLHMTKYFGNEPSGFVSVDLASTTEPRKVKERAIDLQDQSMDPTRGMRLLFDEHTDRAKWETKIPERASGLLLNPKPKMRFLHNRWPCYSTKTSVFELKIQYFICQGTVYQTYEFKLKENETIIPEIPNILIDTNLLLRDLNFITPDYRNSRWFNNVHYSHTAPEGGNCVIRIHRDDNRIPQDRATVKALFISPFINGRPQQPCSFNNGCYLANPDKKAQADLKENKKIRITLAYTLQLASSDEVLTLLSPVKDEDLKNAEKGLKDTIFAVSSFTGERVLDFSLERNLEHILSVCSIPTGSEESPPIALTCGDISGHRITVVASFYAYQFLLLALDYFQEQITSDTYLEGSHEENRKKYASIMESRILRVCRGHVKWLTVKSHSDFSPHTWASGKRISDWEENRRLAGLSLIDIPCHIIKVADFSQMAGARNIKFDCSADFGKFIQEWIDELHRKDANNDCIFPRSDTPRKFHLADNAMIWRALKSIEMVGFKTENPNNKPNQHGFNYSDDIQDSILEKFATNHPRVKTPLLAVTRSLSDSSVSLRIEDIMIFFATTYGLFAEHTTGQNTSDAEQNQNELWKTTLDIQTVDRNNKVLNWIHPLQFGIAVILSAKGRRINSRPAAEMYEYAKSMLLRSSSSNGLFPGLLGEDKEPRVFNDELLRDSFWQTTFAIPYILWTSHKDIQNNPNQMTIHRQMSGISLNDRRMTPGLGIRTPDGSVALDLSDEWLYNRPAFFKFDIDLSFSAVNQFQNSIHMNDNLERHNIRIISRAPIVTQDSYENIRSERLGYIIDVPRGGKSKTEPKTMLITSPYTMNKHIRGIRDPIYAKKRFFHFHRANYSIALNCYLASAEKEEISSFFNKHALYSRSFFEDTTIALNKWVTELHLSFYQLLSDDRFFNGIPTPEKLIFPNSGPLKWIHRAVMSFRFDGDLFDHYWTCHFFEYDPQQILIESLSTKSQKAPIFTQKISGDLKLEPWRQRRVLELMLFDNILREMVQGTKQILEEIKTCVLTNSGLESGSYMGRGATNMQPGDGASTLYDTIELFAKIDNNTFLLTSQRWNTFQRILQVIEDDVKENLEIISLWVNREQERERYRLRWTHHQEQKYGNAISKLQISNNHHVHELKRCLANISSFNASLVRRLEVMRSDLELRGADDIQLFTYVTVVFLPISFATGIFSMSEAPATDTLRGMITTAGIALVVTVMALLNAKIFSKQIFVPIFQTFQMMSDTMLQPALYVFRIALSPVLYAFASGPLYTFRLVYLGWLSALSTLPDKYIHLLDYYLFYPIYELSKRLLSNQAKIQERKIEDALSIKIKHAKKHIDKKSWKAELDSWASVTSRPNTNIV